MWGDFWGWVQCGGGCYVVVVWSWGCGGGWRGGEFMRMYNLLKRCFLRIFQMISEVFCEDG